ncbi:EPS I polysaccharide export outer membrane protein EpsA [Burkholderia multivorans]
MLHNRREWAKAPGLEPGDRTVPFRPRAAVAAGWSSLAVLTISAAVLSGCALAPGMTFSDSSAGTPATAAHFGEASRAVRDAKGSGGTGSAASGSDAAPAGSLIEINDDLIRTELAAVEPGIPLNVRELFATPGPYTLGPGDVLSIVVWDHPELNMPAPTTGAGTDAAGSTSVVGGYTIDSGGKVQFAYAGPIKLSGLTEMEARDLLASKIARYIRNPQVTLRIQAYRSKRVYLDGEVRNPGIQILNDLPMTLPEAINRAGGFTANGDRAAVSVTRGDDTVVVNIAAMIEKGINPDKILLRDGDLVRVYSVNDRKVFVLGEVGRATTLPLNNGRLSLNEALGSAGGVSQYSGDAGQVYVVRGKRPGKPEIFHLDARSPVAMALANDFELKPNDVVFVDAAPLVRWSRVINMFLPSAQTLATGRTAAY